MKSDVVIIGGGASGLMAAYAAARTFADAGLDRQVLVLEKMPRPARKLMITGKGRCNFTNVKDWNDFSAHIRSNPALIRPAFHNLTPAALLDFFSAFGMDYDIERGERAFPSSHRASDVVDTLVRACHSLGVKIECNAQVDSVEPGFRIGLSDGRVCESSRVVIATGGLSYPSTGSSGDGFRWASELGHELSPTFPSLTALVPKGYKNFSGKGGHIDRSTELSPLGRKLCAIQLKNVQLSLIIEGTEADSEFGDMDFTDGGIEGPLGFQLSRKAVKSLVNGSRVALSVDLKPRVGVGELSDRASALWKEIAGDPRSRRLGVTGRYRVLLGKMMPWDLVPAFMEMNPKLCSAQGVDFAGLARSLKEWRFDIAGYVGYERCVVTAGGVSSGSVIAKTMESRPVPGLYFCGEVLDVDGDTGGYNLQAAFSTGALAGLNAAKGIL